MLKKYMTTLLALVLTFGLLAGCGVPAAQTAVSESPEFEQSVDVSTSETKKLSVVTTIFPEYDWVRQILGDKASEVELTLLLDSGVDFHSYQPTADDMVKIATCDLFVYVGGESDEWVEDALNSAANKDVVAVNLLETLGDAVKEEEIVEGMEAEHDHDHDEAHHDENHDAHEHEEEPEYDEHVWLSLKNAKKLVEVLAEKLGELDSANQSIYTANAKAYAEKLEALDNEYEAAAKAGTYDTILFGDRFPFRYLVDDYGLQYYAAFVGCSAESEASFETVAFLADKVDELGLPAVLTIESGDGKIAKTIVETTKSKTAQILMMDSLQSTTRKDVEDGATYLGVMEQNLNVLKQALQ